MPSMTVPAVLVDEGEATVAVVEAVPVGPTVVVVETVPVVVD
jgi:hypothetical protein